MNYHGVRGTCFFSLYLGSVATFNSVLTHIENCCDTIRDWIREGSAFCDMKTIEPTHRFSDAHLRSHFLRIMARFLSRNKINTSGWASVVVAGKHDRAVKAREDGKRTLLLFLFFFIRHVHHRTLPMGAIICFLGSQISKIDPEDHVYEILIEHEIKIMNFHMESSYSVYLKVLKKILHSLNANDRISVTSVSTSLQSFS